MRRFIPLILFFIIIAVFSAMLLDKDRNPKELKSVLIGKPLPSFSLGGLYDHEKPLTNIDLKNDKKFLVNFFASWCVPCRAEHANLMELADEYGVTIIGIAYKDKPEASKEFLNSLGNPYAHTLVDLSGRAGIDFGVTGVPETFLVDKNGIIRYRHWGPIVGDSLDKRLLPKIAEVD